MFRRAVGVAAIAVPVVMGGFSAVLALSFSDPSVMDLPPADVLVRLGRAGDGIVGSWLAVTLSAALFAALVVGLDGVLREDLGTGGHRAARRLPWLAVTSTMGVVAGLFMVLDLSQWVWLYPELGRRFLDSSTTAAGRADLELLWDAFHRYVGVGIGVYGATLFNALWALGSGGSSSPSGPGAPCRCSRWRRVASSWPASLRASGPTSTERSTASGSCCGPCGSCSSGGSWSEGVAWSRAERGHPTGFQLQFSRLARNDECSAVSGAPMSENPNVKLIRQPGVRLKVYGPKDVDSIARQAGYSDADHG